MSNMSSPYLSGVYEPQEEEDVDLEHDNPAVRLGLYHALKDTRGEPGLSIERVARVIMDAFSREEVQALTNQLNKNLDA